ncbi:MULTISPECIES: carboxymuconolactone decarboxylase family protein [Rhodococcus]|uniref:carboxymuconolactone decarboxylase family protein n=1 Tax=Rhodococcus TaxID=1827 RepID=UPI00076131AC|nr:MULTISPECIES: carboxymuconolactone decarboxylase family protein [Rhodococcus]BDB62585.1 carboxymuconolactone decarboxylase [Rhodococcus sp. RDE2]
MALLSPLPAELWDEDVDAALKGLMPRHMRNPEQAGTAMATLVHHPELTKAFLGFSVHLLFRSTLPARLRELVILRVAALHDCSYEREHHIEIARTEAGLTPDEIAAALDGSAEDPFEQRLLDSVRELTETSRLSEETWTALSEHLTTKQLMDLIFTVGGYSLMAMAYNTFGIEFEDER